MGMYTELIFGCALDKDTPAEVVKTLQYMLDKSDFKSENWLTLNHQLFKVSPRWKYMFQMSSYYFGVSEPVNKIWYDEITHNWKVSIRCNIKNYHNEIELFLDWIKPNIHQGSGSKGLYAITLYEEEAIPTLYYLED